MKFVIEYYGKCDEKVCPVFRKLNREEAPSAGSASGGRIGAFPFGARWVKESSPLRFAPLQAFELSGVARNSGGTAKLCSRPEKGWELFILQKGNDYERKTGTDSQ